MPLTTRQFNALLRRSTRLSHQLKMAAGELDDAFTERYGVTYSEIDADEIIEACDYGTTEMTQAQCDEVMERLGYPPRS